MMQPYQKIGFELARQGAKTVRVKITGECMSPLIRKGDWVLVNAGQTRPVNGQILCIQKDEKVIVHRLLEARPEDMITKGDRSATFDSPTQPSSVIGIVVAVERNGRLRRLDTPIFCLLEHTALWLYNVKKKIRVWFS